MNLDQVNALTPSERNRKIAEICGWKPVSTEDGPVLWYHEPSDTHEWEFPNYCGSLDACAEMEERLSSEQDSDTVHSSYYSQQMRFSQIICRMVWADSPRSTIGTANIFTPIHATAEQRSKVFLMVMLP